MAPAATRALLALLAIAAASTRAAARAVVENDGDGIEGSLWNPEPPAAPAGVPDGLSPNEVDSLERNLKDQQVDTYRPTGIRYYVYGDCGSTGTRLHIYRVEDPGAGANKLDDYYIQEVDVVKTPKVPLASLKGSTADQVWARLAPLFVAVENKLPIEHHKHTAVHLMATAGMRLLKDDERKATEAAVLEAVTANTAFGPVTMRTISGEEEGFFGWIAVNYLNGLKFKEFPIPYADLLKANGALDLGGGSVQVVGLSMELVRQAQGPAAGATVSLVPDGNTHEAASSAATYHTLQSAMRENGEGKRSGRRLLQHSSGIKTMRDLYSQLYIRSYLGVGAAQLYDELTGVLASPHGVDSYKQPHVTAFLKESGRAECYNVLHVRKDVNSHHAEYCRSNPCAFFGTSNDLSVEGGRLQERDDATLGAMTNLKGTGQFDECLRLTRAALRDKQLTPGWARPGYDRDRKTGAVKMQIDESLARSSFVGMSLFYHTTHFLHAVRDLIHTLDGRIGAIIDFPNPTVRHIAEAGRRLCAMEFHTVQSKMEGKDPTTPGDRLWGRCFDTVLVTALLGGHDDPDQDEARRAEILAFPRADPNAPNYGVPTDPFWDADVMGIPMQEAKNMVPPPPPPVWPAKAKSFVGFGIPQDGTNIQYLDEVADTEVEWALGALVFDLRDSTKGATSLIGAVPGGGGAHYRGHNVFSLMLEDVFVAGFVIALVGGAYVARHRVAAMAGLLAKGHK